MKKKIPKKYSLKIILEENKVYERKENQYALKRRQTRQSNKKKKKATFF